MSGVDTLISGFAKNLGVSLLTGAVAELSTAASKARNPKDGLVLAIASAALEQHGTEGLRAIADILSAHAAKKTPDIKALVTLDAVTLSNLTTQLQNMEAEDLRRQAAGLRAFLAFLSTLLKAATGV